MVSKAREDLPEPDRPVSTTSWSRGISRSMFLRLCSRAPRIAMTRVSARRRCWSNRSFIRSVFLEHNLFRKPVPTFRDHALQVVDHPRPARPDWSFHDAARQSLEHSKNRPAAPARTLAQAAVPGMTAVDKLQSLP